MARKICILTGTRAEYGLLKPVMKEIHESSDLELQLIVTGMHLLKEFGYTINEIKKDGFKINSEIDMSDTGDGLDSMALSVGKGIIGITKSLKKLNPDILVVLGDRIEPLAGTISASILRIPIAHLGGGQISGGVDNTIRQIISKAASIHFVRTPDHAKKLLDIGEDKSRIHVVGSFCLDTILNINFLKKEEIEKKFKINLKEPLFLVVFHPDTLNIKTSLIQIKDLCKSLKKINEQTIFIYPNADAGGKKILKIIEECVHDSKIHLFKNLPQIEFLSIMKNADIMIGNSSSGLIEAPSFGLPVINIGNRQKGRDKLNNVIDSNGKEEEIISIAQRILNDEDYRKKLSKCKSVYGKGEAGKKIVEVLSEIEINDNLIYKN